MILLIKFISSEDDHTLRSSACARGKCRRRACKPTSLIETSHGPPAAPGKIHDVLRSGLFIFGFDPQGARRMASAQSSDHPLQAGFSERLVSA